MGKPAVRISLDPVSLPELTTPERQLWAAVLLLAVQDIASMNTYLPGGALKAFARRQAEAWVKSPACGPGSFLWICDRLELDAAAVRHQVLKAPTEALVARIKAVDGRGGNRGRSSLADEVSIQRQAGGS